MEQKPQIPTLKDSQKPQVKIKGLSALSLIERLKQFKKKDLAFILAGLGVLLMAPLAEHFLMSPESADSGAFKPGWGFQPTGRFGDGSSPYEGGAGGLSPGGPAGGGADVITPLNVRDPSALIMGPGGQQQPAATATSPSKEPENWRDAIANAAAKGGSAATKAARLPMPKPSLTSAMRGLGAISGGSGASYSLPPISAANVPNKAAGSSSPQVSAPGFRGAAHGPQNASGASMEDLKAAAARAGSEFGRTGAGSSLLNAASQAMPHGDGGFGGGPGQGGVGGPDKGGSGNQEKGSKSMGESLEFIAKKDWQQKLRDLEYEKLKKKEMFWPDLQRDLVKEMLTAPVKKMAEVAAKKLVSGKDAKDYYCYTSAPDAPPFRIEGGDVDIYNSACTTVGQKGDEAKQYCICPTGTGKGLSICIVGTSPLTVYGSNCSSDKDVKAPGAKDNTSVAHDINSPETQADLKAMEKKAFDVAKCKEEQKKWSKEGCDKLGAIQNGLSDGSKNLQTLQKQMIDYSDKLLASTKQALAVVTAAQSALTAANNIAIAPNPPQGTALEQVQIDASKFQAWQAAYTEYGDKCKLMEAVPVKLDADKLIATIDQNILAGQVLGKAEDELTKQAAQTTLPRFYEKIKTIRDRVVPKVGNLNAIQAGLEGQVAHAKEHGEQIGLLSDRIDWIQSAAPASSGKKPAFPSNPPVAEGTYMSIPEYNAVLVAPPKINKAEELAKLNAALTTTKAPIEVTQVAFKQIGEIITSEQAELTTQKKSLDLPPATK